MGTYSPIWQRPSIFATPENEWAETLHPHFPEWLIVWDMHAVTDFYEGESTVPWALWIKPLIVWDSFYPTALLPDYLRIDCGTETVD